MENNSPSMKLLILAQNNYGKVRLYPANPLAEKLAKFIKVKSFTTENLDSLKEMGFEIEITHPVVWPKEVK